MTAADVHAAASGIARADVASKGAIEMAENVFRPMMAGYPRLVGQRVAQTGGAMLLAPRNPQHLCFIRCGPRRNGKQCACCLAV